MMASSREHILVVDDDDGLLRLLKMRLAAMKYAVTTCTDGRQAVQAAKDQVFDLAILDLRLGEWDGLVLMEELQRIQADLPVLILTAHGSIPNAVEAVQKGAFGYLTKPFDDGDLKRHLEKALTQQRLRREVHRLQRLVKDLYGLENVVARSSSMQGLLQQIGQVAETDATICLFGETGTGKEVLARVIHANSRRAHGPFVAVNCAAIPDTMFESELFGHVRGAFTGAHQSKPGLFQSAQGGTLFLDEIGEIPRPLQAKLLRALQEREVLEVGATQPTKVDARIVAATNLNLEQAVQEGAFREDLYYRIQVVPLHVPPLRERRDDIPALAHHFLQESCRRINKAIRGFQPDAMQRMMRHPWPGNVRELENVVEKAVILTTQDQIPGELIPSDQSDHDPSIKSWAAARADFERTYLRRLLDVTGGNISRAAQLAGRYRADLYKLLKKYRLHPDSKSDQGTPLDERANQEDSP